MIEINLVPVEARKKSARANLFAVPLAIRTEVLLGAAGIFAVVVLGHIIVFGMMAVNTITLNGQKAAWAKLQPQKSEIDAIITKTKDTAQQLTTVKNIVPSRSTGWARRLNVISDTLTKGMWLRRITLDNNALTIEGSAVSKNQDEITFVSTFVANLKKDPAFAGDFSSIEVNSIQKTKRGTTEIADFIVSAKLK